MIFETETMTLESVMEEYSGKVNDVYVCKRLGSGIDTFYTVHSVRDHEIAKTLIDVFERSPHGRESLSLMSGEGEMFLLAFDYVKPRPLSEFYMGSERNITECEDILKGIIAQCVSSKLPLPFLYLVLKQRKINIAVDMNISFSTSVDLSLLDATVDEKMCAREAAIICLELLGEYEGRVEPLSVQLLRNKIARGSYTSFREIYTDVMLAAKPKTKMSFRERWDRFKRLYGKVFFRIIMVLAIVLGILTIIMFLSNTIAGDIPLFRLFRFSFKTIGTESLV